MAFFSFMDWEVVADDSWASDCFGSIGVRDLFFMSVDSDDFDGVNSSADSVGVLGVVEVASFG